MQTEPKIEKQNKRRNLLRWRQSRLRRLGWQIDQATERQLARHAQLVLLIANQLQNAKSAY